MLFRSLEEQGAAAFDAVLLDVQMPELDGYQTARKIRETILPETLPLIAMTAHAMSEERDRCLAAGMQEHIVKPADIDRLVASLRRWTGLAKLAEAPPAPTPQSAANPPGIDLQTALSACAGNRALMFDLLAQFRQRYEGAADEVQRLCETGQKEQAFVLIHTIRGAAVNLGMEAVASTAATLEASPEDEAALPSFRAAMAVVCAGISPALKDSV